MYEPIEFGRKLNVVNHGGLLSIFHKKLTEAMNKVITSLEFDEQKLQSWIKYSASHFTEVLLCEIYLIFIKED
jgi:hypothetical protein